MAQLYSQYESGTEWSAGAIVGSTLGVSGANPLVDRLNSIATSDNVISGTSVVANIGSGTIDKTPVDNADIANKAYVDSNAILSEFAETDFSEDVALTTGIANVGSIIASGIGLGNRSIIVTAHMGIHQMDEDEGPVIAYIQEAGNNSNGVIAKGVIADAINHDNNERHTFPVTLVGLTQNDFNGDNKSWTVVLSGASMDYWVSGTIRYLLI